MRIDHDNATLPACARRPGARELPATVRTLPELLSWRAALTPSRPAYAEYDAAADDWRETSWREASDAVHLHLRALSALGVGERGRIGILLPNGYATICIDLATLAGGWVPVPMHALDNPASIAYILGDTGAEVLFVETAAQWAGIQASGLAAPSLRTVIVRRGDVTQPDDGQRPRLLAFEAWLRMADADAATQAAAPKATDLAAIVYTSGTTGRPKGVMLTHANVMSNVRACLARFEAREDDRFLSFLPLSHTFERTAGYYLPMAAGACVAYARSVDRLPDDLRRVRPTILVSVPRVYEKAQARIDAALARSLAARLAFRCAVAAGWRRHLRQLGAPGACQWSQPVDDLCTRLLDARVGRPLRDQFGGRLRVAVSGGAALAPAIARNFIGLGVEIVQGYGMTETSPVVTANAPGDNDPSTVGRPLCGIELRIGEQRELQVRGPGVMRGYWNRPEDSERAFTDGWLRTGDQAEIVDGRLRILGRIKDIIVTATGEKIAPLDVEQALMADPLFEQACVFGEGRPFIGCVLQLEASRWTTLARALDLDPDATGSLDASEALRAVEARMKAATSSLPRHGQPRRAILALDPWTTANGLLTPTLKLKRRNIEARFAAQIAALYGR
ncbi:MAG: long-chain fatty acid--CoA ligase [Burkholderiales bacterium]|nr:long-chain fatty acid--CoA ligase [Burkholderiales bacterium]